VGVCVDERSHHKYRILCVRVQVVGWCIAVGVWVRDTVGDICTAHPAL